MAGDQGVELLEFTVVQRQQSLSQGVEADCAGFCAALLTNTLIFLGFSAIVRILSGVIFFLPDVALSRMGPQDLAEALPCRCNPNALTPGNACAP